MKKLVGDVKEIYENATKGELLESYAGLENPEEIIRSVRNYFGLILINSPF